LDVFEDFADCGINDGVGSVECDSHVGIFFGEADHVMIDDGVGLVVTAAGMMGLLGWEALVTFYAVGATPAGASL
jgi:hypothetical protein